MRPYRDQLIDVLGLALENLQASQLDPLGVDRVKIIDIVDLSTRIAVEVVLECIQTSIVPTPKVSTSTPPEEPAFVLVVARMRRHQKAFCAHGQREDLVMSQELERHVDAMIDELTGTAAKIMGRAKGGT